MLQRIAAKLRKLMLDHKEHDNELITNAIYLFVYFAYLHFVYI